MSLINQMLRDLEQRKDTLKIPVTTALPMAHSEQRWKLKPVLFIVFSLLGLIVLFLQREDLLNNLDQQLLRGTHNEVVPANPTLANRDAPVAPPPKMVSETAVPVALAPTVNQPPLALSTPTPTAASATATAPTPLPAPNTSTTVAENLPVSEANQIKPQPHRQLKLRPRSKPALKAKTPASDITQAIQNDTSPPPVMAEHNPITLQTQWLKAKTLLSQKQGQAALRILESSAPKTSNETYLALLGAAQQQIGKTYQASTTYQQLLRQRPEKAEYWLGFAIAQEHNGNTSSAREAYDQALRKNSLATPVIEYIKQRQSALSPE